MRCPKFVSANTFCTREEGDDHSGSHTFKSPLELEGEIAELQRQLADAQAQKGELIERALVGVDSAILEYSKGDPHYRKIYAELIKKITRNVRALDPDASSAWQATQEREKRLRELVVEWKRRAKELSDASIGSVIGELNWRAKRYCDRIEELEAALSAPEDRHGTSEGES